MADRVRGLDPDLRDQLDPDPDDLPVPRVRGRPWLGADHWRAGESDERAPEDLERDVPDPAARPARGPGDERVLHHSGVREARDVRAVHGPSAAREAPGGAGANRARDGPPGLEVGVTGQTLRV